MSQWKRFERDRRVIKASGVADRIEQLLAPTSPTTAKRMGRPRQLTVEVLLTAILRAFRDGQSVRLNDVHLLLTKGLPRSYRQYIGVTRPDGKTIKLDTLYYLVAHIAARLDTNPTRTKNLDKAGIARREQDLQAISDMILAATLPSGAPTGCEYAVDATAIDTWARPHRSPSDDDANRGANADVRSFDPDARYGHRTKTHHNRTKWVFGYQAVAFARVDGDGPAFVERLVLAPGNSQGVDEARDLLTDWQQQRKTDGHDRIRKILCDRGFSNATEDRWADPLRHLHIEQVIDIHPNEHGARPYESIVMIDGHPHHPAIPKELRSIERPPTLSAGPLADNADAETRAAHQERVDKINDFRELMRRRHVYAYRRIQSPDIDGKERFEAPCCAGKLRDPACEISMHLPGNLPTITYQPGTTPPAHKRTITLPRTVQGKLRQHLLWGSDAWIAEYSRRTAVEGQFSNWKSQDGERVERGWIRLVGRVKTTLMITLAAAASNLRQFRKHAQTTGDYTDPKARPVIDNDDHEEVDAHGNPAPYRPGAPVTYTPADTPRPDPEAPPDTE